MRATIATLSLVAALSTISIPVQTLQAQTSGTVSSRGIVVRGAANRAAYTTRRPRVSIPLATSPTSRQSATVINTASQQAVEAETYIDSQTQVVSSTPLRTDQAVVRNTARPVYYTANQQTVLAGGPCSTCGASPCACGPATTYYQQAVPVPTISPGACCDPCNPCDTCTQPCAPCCPTRRVGLRPVIDVGTRDPCLQTGRGILGQPKVYVPGQPVRNFVRWLTP